MPIAEPVCSCATKLHAHCGVDACLLVEELQNKIKSNWGPVPGQNTEQQQTQAALPVIHQILFVLSDRIAQKLKADCFRHALQEGSET